MIPTPQLRWVERQGEINPLATYRILQQWWEAETQEESDNLSPGHWVDVPMGSEG